MSIYKERSLEHYASKMLGRVKRLDIMGECIQD